MSAELLERIANLEARIKKLEEREQRQPDDHPTPDDCVSTASVEAHFPFGYYASLSEGG